MTKEGEENSLKMMSFADTLFLLKCKRKAEMSLEHLTSENAFSCFVLLLLTPSPLRKHKSFPVTRLARKYSTRENFLCRFT